MITLTINQDTPKEVIQASANYLLKVSDIIHGDPRQSVIPLPAAETKSPAEVIATAKARAKEISEAEEEDEVAGEPPLAKEDADVNGVFWDKRIHSANATTMADGSWRPKRGVAKNVVEQVLAEQRNTASAVEEAPSAPPAPAVEEAPAAPAAPAVEEAPAAPVAPVPMVEQRSFSELLQLVSTKIQANPLVAPKLQEAVSAAGFASIPLLQEETPSNIARVYDAIEAVEV